MTGWSPTAEGFRAIFRRPSFSLAEIVWRWSFAASVGVLCTLSLFAYLDTLRVSAVDQVLLRTRHPVLVGHALSHILRGSAARFVFAGVLLAAGLAVLWILFASIGRATILNALVLYVRERARKTGSSSDDQSRVDQAQEPLHVHSLLGLNFLRAILMLTALTSLVGAMLVSSDVSSESVLAFLIFLSWAMLTAFFWWSLNWFLSLAAVFVVREGQDTFSAISSAVRLCRERLGPVVAVGAWFGLAHLILFVIATSAVGVPLSLAALVPAGLVIAGIVVVTLAYFALADALYLGRLAGYVAILEAPALPLLIPPLFGPGSPPSALCVQPASSMVDQDELILSDQVDEASAQPAPSIPPAAVDQDERILSDHEPSDSVERL